MKTKIAALWVLGAGMLVSICIASSATQPRSTDEITALRAELRKTQSQLEQTIARTETLERQVNSLEASNARLESEVNSFGQWKLIPVQERAQSPGFIAPKIVPVQAK